MKLSLISENIEDFIPTIVKRENITPQQALDNVLACYPGGAKGKEADFIAKLWANNKIRLPEDTNRAIEAIANFKKYKPRLTIKDINQYKTITEIETAVEPFVGTSSKSSGGLGFNPLSLPGTRLINRKNSYIVVQVTNVESLKDLGEGTKWCTRRSYNPCKAEDYMKDLGSINIIFNGDKPLVQYAPDFSQVLDVNDEEVVDRKLLDIIPPPNPNSDANTQYDYAYKVLGLDVHQIDKNIIIKSSQGAFEYASSVVKGRWPIGEHAIMRDPNLAFVYAAKYIKNRWLEAEPYIMKDPMSALNYSRDIIKDRWPEAEPYIKQNTKLWNMYCTHFGIG